MEELWIRRAVEGDYEAVRKLEEIDFGFHRAARPDYFKDSADSYPAEEFRALLALPCPIAWVAELEGRMVGLCFGNIGPGKEGRIFAPRRVALIEDLVTLPEYRGRGIATALLERARDQARAEGAVSLELCVWGFNQGARRLYEGFGMEVQYLRMEQPL